MAEQTEVLKVRITSELHADLKRVAKDQGRSVSNTVRQAIERYVREAVWTMPAE